MKTIVLAMLVVLLASGAALGAVPLGEPIVGDPETASSHLVRMGLPVPVDLVEAVARGEDLFFNEQFDGNGRTCGTCHPAENNLTLDRNFIGTWPDDDPLFVAEFNPQLQSLERPNELRSLTLILEDTVDQFLGDRTPNRSVPHLFGMALTIASNRMVAPLENTGLSGDGAPGDGTLRSFPTGAVIQHFTTDLARVEGVHFRLPTENELDDLFLFMLALGPPELPDLASMQFVDPVVQLGLEQFLGPAKCNQCHLNGGSEITIPGFEDNLINTGVESSKATAGIPRDGGFGLAPDGLGGFGDGRFASPPLIFAADTPPFFHNSRASTLGKAISFYNSRAFRESPGNQAIKNADPAGEGLVLRNAPLIAVLSALNVLENARSARCYLERSLTHGQPESVLEMAGFELEDAVLVAEKAGKTGKGARAHFEQARLLAEQARAGFDAALVAAALDEIDAGCALIVVK